VRQRGHSPPVDDASSLDTPAATPKPHAGGVVPYGFAPPPGGAHLRGSCCVRPWGGACSLTPTPPSQVRKRAHLGVVEVLAALKRTSALAQASELVVKVWECFGGCWGMRRWGLSHTYTVKVWTWLAGCALMYMAEPPPSLMRLYCPLSSRNLLSSHIHPPHPSLRCAQQFCRPRSPPPLPPPPPPTNTYVHRDDDSHIHPHFSPTLQRRPPCCGPLQTLRSLSPLSS
jgi:hypothetical protein